MTQVMQIEIDNLKCGGCDKTILKGLNALGTISVVSVDQERQLVQFTGDEAHRASVADKLLSMGYPEKDTLSGMGAGLANAKSYVSCAIGRIT